MMLKSFKTNFLKKGFNYLKMNILSPNAIKNLSEKYSFFNNCITGRVTNDLTFNLKTKKPLINGLFCETIFGASKNWSCSCGHYLQKIKNKSYYCEYCKAEFCSINKRRYTTGYIKLSNLVINSTFLNNNYFKDILSLINLPLSDLEINNLIYYKSFQSFNFLYNKVNKNNFNCSFNFSDNKKSFLDICFNKLKNTNYNIILDLLRNEIINSNSIKKLKQLRLLESFYSTKTSPSWMILTTFPVIPPIYRNYKLFGKHFLLSKKAKIYQELINANQKILRIKKYVKFSMKFWATNFSTLQECIDKFTGFSETRLNKFENKKKFSQHLIESVEKKKKHFKQSLIGKRVDYSGRSVIIPGPNLNIDQCGLPYKLASELFRPQLLNIFRHQFKLKSKIEHQNLFTKKKLIIWKLLIKMCNTNFIMLNRSPTLHKYSIQSFNPVLTTSLALILHPLICAGLNADFDGDQVAVHLSFYPKNKYEFTSMMKPSSNIFNSSDEQIILKPVHEIIVGCYYLTRFSSNLLYSVKNCCLNLNAALALFTNKQLTLHSPFLIYFPFDELINKKKRNSFYFNFKNKIIDIITKNLIIYKIFIISHVKNKFYLLTNYGICILKKVSQFKYKIQEMLLETTIGQLIFNKKIINFNNFNYLN